MKARTVNYELFCLQQLLKRAGLLVTVPGALNGRFACQRQVQEQSSIWPQLDVCFRQATTTPLWMVAFCASLLAYCTGMRAGEIRSLLL